MRLALTAGGTGGHIFPALSVLAAMEARGDVRREDVRFIGPDNRGERAMVESHGVEFQTVPAAPVRDRGPISLARSVASLSWGTLTALRHLISFKPDAVFSTGGYASFPCSVAARLVRRPLVVYLPDVSPGWAVRAETRLATRMATTAEAALRFLPREKTVITGYPVRAAFFDISRDEARRKLGIRPEDHVLLVAGASQGSRAINDALFAALPRILKTATVLHITGAADEAHALTFDRTLDPALGGRYFPAAFRDDLPDAMLAADLAVMRSGASVLGELPAAALPSLLIPGTWAGAHQRDNARWLADGGAAELLEEKDISGLAARILTLLADSERLAEMRAAAAALARPDAASAIADVILEVARK